jgi:hypothetical protein
MDSRTRLIYSRITGPSKRLRKRDHGDYSDGARDYMLP